MSTTDQDTSDRLARAVSLARRGRRFALGAVAVFVIGITLTALMTTRVKRVFLSECTFVVRAAERPGDDRADSMRKRSARLKEMAHERARLEAVIRKFNLYPGIVDSAGILEAVEAMRPHVGVRARDSGRYVVSFDTAEIPGIDTRNLVRDIAQNLAETVAEDYVGASIGELRNDADFLTKEVAGASDEIDSAVKVVSKFLALHPEYAVEIPAGISVGIARVAKKPAWVEARHTTDPLLASLLRQKASLEAEQRTPPTQATPRETLPRDQAAAAVEAATRAYAVAQADVLIKSAKLTSEHPDMVVAKALASIAAKQLQEARADLAAIDAKTAAPSGTVPEKLKQLEAQIAAREAALAAKPASEVAPAAATAVDPLNAQVDLSTEWQRVLRDLGESKKRYDELKTKSEAVLLALKASEVRKANLVAIVDPAYRPTRPTNGRRGLTALVGLSSASAFALIYMIARVLLDNKLTDVGDVEALALGPVLGTMLRIERHSRGAPPPEPAALAPVRRVSGTPFNNWPIRAVPVTATPTAPEILAVVSDDPRPIAALRLVRHRLELHQAEGMRVFAITSARDCEGKSTFAAQLALVLSESQRARVVLVEACFRRPPALARTLGFEVPFGTALSGQVARAMRGEIGDPWRVLAIGPSLHVLAESDREQRLPRALHSACFRELLQMLGEVYDYVLVDAPPVLAGGEANTLEPIVDGVIVVSRAGHSTKTDLRHAIRQLGPRKTIGTVLVGEAAKGE